MEESDSMGIIISVVALIVSAINVLFYIILQGKYNKMTKIQMLTAQGAIETQVRNSISDATKEVLHYTLEVQKDPNNKIIQQAYFSAEEMYRNAYEDACGKYNDGKIDPERFEKMYKQEIYKLVNDPQQKEFYATNQTPYATTVSVYKKWFSQV